MAVTRYSLLITRYDPPMVIHCRLADVDFLAGIVIARGVSVAPAPPELASRLDELVARRAAEEFPPPAVKEAVRDMLRRGGYKPAGRGKPASEYLAQAAREGRFPRINNLVDINNLVSLESGLPISMLDADAVGPEAEVRYGRPGETYVFNAAGQSIDLAGLVCICRVEGDASAPLGNPVKDSMAGKLKEGTRNVVAVIFGSEKACDAATMERHAASMAALIREHAGATYTESRLARGA